MSEERGRERGLADCRNNLLVTTESSGDTNRQSPKKPSCPREIGVVSIRAERGGQ